MYYIRTYPLSIITIIVIWYLSFFTPPQTELNNVPFIDKIVHICMYGGLTMVIWFEYLRLHKFIVWKKLITGGIILPIESFFTISTEVLQFFLQLLPGKINTALYSTKWKPQLICYLTILEP